MDDDNDEIAKMERRLGGETYILRELFVELNGHDDTIHIPWAAVPRWKN